jgi:hypothetical protein
LGAADPHRTPRGVDPDYQALVEQHIQPPDFQRGRHFVGLVRLSSPKQARNGNFIGQVKTLREIDPSQGATLDDIYYCVCPSRPCPERTEHYREVSSMAIERDATIIAVKLDRFARPLDYLHNDARRRLARLTLEDFHQLSEDTQGVPLMTILPPWVGAKESHRVSILGGRQARGARGGRPRKPVVEHHTPGYCRDRRKEFEPLAKFLDSIDTGPGDILDCLAQLGVVIDRSTLWRWLRERPREYA